MVPLQPERALPIGDGRHETPWFTHRGLVLGGTLATIIGAVGGFWLMPANFMRLLVTWSVLLCGTGFLAFVVKARGTYARARLPYPVSFHRPAILPYLLAFLVFGLATWAARPAPKPSRTPVISHITEGTGRAVYGVMGIGVMFAVVLPLLSAHAGGRIVGFYAGLLAAQRRAPENTCP